MKLSPTSLEKLNRIIPLSFLKIAFYVCLVLIFALGLCCSYLILTQPIPEGVENKLLFPIAGLASPGDLPYLSEKEVLDQMQKEVDSSMFSFKINPRPLFKDGNSEGNLQIVNPVYNNYPFVVAIFLSENGKLIYESGGILPNHHIADAKLSIPLVKGDHEAVAYFYAFDPESYAYCGKTAVNLRLQVLN